MNHGNEMLPSATVPPPASVPPPSPGTTEWAQRTRDEKQQATQNAVDAFLAALGYESRDVHSATLVPGKVIVVHRNPVARTLRDPAALIATEHQTWGC